MPEFKKLFEPGKMGKIEVKNRIIFAPCGTHYSSLDGLVTDRTLAYYAERARGGVGLLVVEGCRWRMRASAGGWIMATSDKYIPGLKKLVDTIHEAGAKAIIQMAAHRGSTDEEDPASPSGIPHPFSGWSSVLPSHPRAVPAADLEELVNEIGDGARRCMEAGFDGVMIHGANGYLACELLSRRFNKRTDAYGGDLRGRAKYILDTIKVIREKTSPDFPIVTRLMGSDRVSKPGDPDGWGIADTVELCKIIEETGVTAIDITSGSQETPEWTAPPYFLAAGCNTDITGAIKKAGIKTPVWITGKIMDPSLAEQILEDGKADYICLGRGLMADPHWANKAKEGRVEDIRKCICDDRCLEDVMIDFVPISCTVNPMIGKESQLAAKLPRLTKKKKVLVVGGGPGGMQAAIIAAKKGHDVTLYEKGNQLGGQLLLAIAPPDKDDLKNLLNYFKTQLTKTGVKVELNKTATSEAVRKFAPDAVIVAIGSVPFIPEIPGVKGANVLNCREVLSEQKKTGKKVVIVGGGYVGCETSLFLAKRAVDVTMVFRSPEPALDVKYWMFRKYYQDKMKANNVKIMPQVKYGQITPKGISLTDKEGKEVFLEADNIVLAAGSKAEKSLGEALKGKYLEFFEVGDCIEPRRIREAIEEAIWAAVSL
jgi:2,4-dienoyl-CoA reductase-like NADH-dependent reductase (Old Yellow Enzyme family)/thioredoxin reductase